MKSEKPENVNEGIEEVKKVEISNLKVLKSLKVLKRDLVVSDLERKRIRRK